MELAGEIRNEFLTCSICMEGYTMPKQLPCLHTFCRQCLSRYICRTVGASGVLTVPCPLCRRLARPTNPDPRKLSEWADQFPDNFFIASLLETVEKKGSSQVDLDKQENIDSDSYFMGKAKSCSKHMTSNRTHYCLTHKTGICDTCLAEDPHNQCSSDSHLDSEAARSKATDLLHNYRQEMGRVRDEVNGVIRSLKSKPRHIQVRKDEAEIMVAEYFSKLKVSFAKFLLGKEQEMIDSLDKAVQDEAAQIESSQKDCDNIMTSVDNTVSLFDTLTCSGPLNAMHVLRTMEEQVANFSRLSGKLDQEAKADTLLFQPPNEELEDQLASWDFGSIIADFGRGEVLVAGSALVDTRSGDAGASGSSSRSSALEKPDEASSNASEAELDGYRNMLTKVNIHSQQEESEQDLKASALEKARRDDGLGPKSTTPSAPPPPYEEFSLPSAPPLSGFPQDGMSVAQAKAYSRSIRKDFSCAHLSTFVANLPSDRSNRGGICGATNIHQMNRAAFVDRFNRSVKIVDLASSQVVGMCDLANQEPWDITFKDAVDEVARELIITCPATRCLLFMPTGNQYLQVTAHVYTPVGYCCIAFLKEDRIVAGTCLPYANPEVHVVSVNGNILHRIMPPQPFKYPRSVYANKEGNLIVISDWTSNLITVVDTDGNMLCQYREVSGAKGVAVSEITGLVHVVDAKKHMIHVLDTHGNCIQTCKVQACTDMRTVVAVPVYSGKFPLRNEVLVVTDGYNKMYVLGIYGKDYIKDTTL